MTTKVDHIILPQLRQALIDNCPVIKETEKRIGEALAQSSYPELAEAFHLVPWILVTNVFCISKGEKPIFELRRLDIDYSELPLFDENEETKKKRRTGEIVFSNIKDKMENEGKLPVVIQAPNRIINIKDCLNAGNVFGLPQEIENERQKLIKPFDNAHTINY